MAPKTITNESEATGTRTRLAIVQGRISVLRAERESIADALGDAMVAQAMGDLGEQQAATLTRRAEIDRETGDLELVEGSLLRSLEAWNAGSIRRRGEAARDRCYEMAAEARDLEKRYGELFVEMAALSSRLRHLHVDFLRPMSVAGENGCPVPSSIRPKTPLFASPNEGNLCNTNPELAVEVWKGSTMQEASAKLIAKYGAAPAAPRPPLDPMDRMNSCLPPAEMLQDKATWLPIPEKGPNVLPSSHR